MKKKFTPFMIFGLIVEIAALVFIILSIFSYPKNNTYLDIALCCCLVGSVCMIIQNKILSKKK